MIIHGHQLATISRGRYCIEEVKVDYGVEGAFAETETNAFLALGDRCLST